MIPLSTTTNCESSTRQITNVLKSTFKKYYVTKFRCRYKNDKIFFLKMKDLKIEEKKSGTKVELYTEVGELDLIKPNGFHFQFLVRRSDFSNQGSATLLSEPNPFPIYVLYPEKVGYLYLSNLVVDRLSCVLLFTNDFKFSLIIFLSLRISHLSVIIVTS